MRKRWPFLIGAAVWLVLLYVAATNWADFVDATGDTTSECDRGKCGTLGEFTSDHSLVLFLLMAAGTAIPAALLAWVVSRLERSRSFGV
jgi:hypothetical protein